jgi:CRP/FNR family transcriptional regulator
MPSPCASCSLRGACLPRLIGAEHDAHLERLVYARRRLRAGEALFHAGDAFASVYAVFSGSFKARAADAQAREQVTGFHMAGELLGLDGFAGGRHQVSALALEDSVVCALPHALIDEIGREVPALQRGLHAALAQEIVREQCMMLVLGAMRAEERLAAFLLSLSRRFARHGYSPHEYTLRMTREDIGSYLGLTTETVSRLFTGLREAGVLEVNHRRLRILDAGQLEARAMRQVDASQTRRAAAGHSSRLPRP